MTELATYLERISLKDLKMGAAYPSRYRVHEECMHFSEYILELAQGGKSLPYCIYQVHIRYQASAFRDSKGQYVNWWCQCDSGWKKECILKDWYILIRLI